MMINTRNTEMMVNTRKTELMVNAKCFVALCNTNLKI